MTMHNFSEPYEIEELLKKDKDVGNSINISNPTLDKNTSKNAIYSSVFQNDTTTDASNKQFCRNFRDITSNYDDDVPTKAKKLELKRKLKVKQSQQQTKCSRFEIFKLRKRCSHLEDTVAKLRKRIKRLDERCNVVPAEIDRNIAENTRHQIVTIYYSEKQDNSSCITEALPTKHYEKEAYEERIDEDDQFPNLNALSSPKKLEDGGSCNAEVQYQQRFEDDPTSEDLQNCFSDPTKAADCVFFNVILDDNEVVSDISVNSQINYQLHRSYTVTSSNNEHFDKAHVGQTQRMEQEQMTTQRPNCNDELNVCQRNGQASSSAGYSKPREKGVEGRSTRSIKKKKELPNVAITIQTSDSIPKKVRGVLMQDSPPYRCNICDKTYSSKSSWRWHQQKHILKPFLCPKCKKSFAKESCLIAHQATHTEMKPYKCEICGARFKHNHTKLKHERYMHTEVACFECAVCGKMFNHRTSIIQHLRVHSDKKPFRCQTCGTSFPSKSQLVSHQRMHSKEKNFKCGICNQRFKYVHNKTKHERLHVEGSRFECALCGRKYRTKSNLARHIHISFGCS
ncbi:zinc finger protein 3-like [Planococcus citri]|uniref:zinc finger protein 3-like n=1 Tax=Planococcus citri TaxID=170843 RepID=UPI0031F76434